MGRWLDRLKKVENPNQGRYKTYETGFVGFVAYPEGHSGNSAGGFVGFVASPPEPFQNLKEPANDPVAQPVTPVVADIPAEPAAESPPDWHALDMAYQAHHWGCPACIGGGQGRGQRCAVGLALWRDYEAAEQPKPARGRLVVPHAAEARQGAQGAAGEPAFVTSTRTRASDDASPMSAVEIDRFMARVERFTRPGLNLDRAEALADRLHQRDRDGDDRRMCLECLHCGGIRSCGQCKAAGLNNSDVSALVFRLQRCDAFKQALP